MYIFFLNNFRYELSDGQYREETIRIIGEGTADEEIVVSGEYSFTSDDGNVYVVKYTADKNGYHAETSQHPATVKPGPEVFLIPPNLIKSLVG